MMGIDRRIFLVGCPRSGTTMLQTVIAAHPEVMSFPESRLYRSVESQQRVLQALGWASRHAYGRMQSIYEELVLDPGDLRRRWTVAGYAQDFFRTLDRSALAAGKTVWLEKTPDHVQRLKEIQSVLPEAVFIHLIRGGAETVASLYDVTQRFPEAWGQGPWSLERCIARWREDVAESLQYATDPSHCLVGYEMFVADPETGVQQLCRFMGLDVASEMMQRDAGKGEEVVLSNEPWKTRSAQSIRAGGGKFATVFDESQQARVLDSLAGTQSQLDAVLCP